MSERIAKLKVAVEKAANGPAFHVHSVPVKEVFQGKTIWEGIVAAFALSKNAPAIHCYAWSFKDDNGEEQFVTVMEKPPVTSPHTAVRAYIASLGKK